MTPRRKDKNLLSIKRIQVGIVNSINSILQFKFPLIQRKSTRYLKTIHRRTKDVQELAYSNTFRDHIHEDVNSISAVKKRSYVVSNNTSNIPKKISQSQNLKQSNVNNRRTDSNIFSNLAIRKKCRVRNRNTFSRAPTRRSERIIRAKAIDQPSESKISATPFPQCEGTSINIKENHRSDAMKTSLLSYKRNLRNHLKEKESKSNQELDADAKVHPIVAARQWTKEILRAKSSKVGINSPRPDISNRTSPRIIHSNTILELTDSQALCFSPSTPAKTGSGSGGEVLRRFSRKDWKWNSTDFTELKKIGSGYFGDVYRAFALPLKDKVALKYINMKRANKEDVMMEYSVLKKLSHENLSSVLGEFKDQGNWVFVLNFCSFGDLHDYIYGTGNFDISCTTNRSQKFLTQVISAIFYLHTKAHYIHMDLKPENILICSPNKVQITDFGTVVRMSACRQRFDFECHRGGTKIYWPPEMLMKEGFDSTTDVWSIGCIAYIMLLKIHPFFLDQEESGYVSEDKNLERALERIYEMRNIGFDEGTYKELPTMIKKFCRQIFGSPWKRRPVIRDLKEGMGCIN